MVAFNFQSRFAPMVEAGVKLQTIRQKARAKPGDRLQLYTGQRTAACRKLVEPDPGCTVSTYCAVRRAGITLGNVALLPAELRDQDMFAKADGFRDYDDMVAWFEGQYGLGEFVGRLIRWSHPTPTRSPDDEER